MVLESDHPEVLAPVAISLLDATTDDDAIVLLHDIGTSRYLWHPLVSVADQVTPRAHRYTFVTMDFPAHGNTPPSPNRFGLVEAKLHLDMVLRRIKADRIHLIAHGIATAALYDIPPEQMPAWRNEHHVASIIAVEGNLTPADTQTGVISRILAYDAHTFASEGWQAMLDAFDQSEYLIDGIWAREWRHTDPYRIHALARETSNQPYYAGPVPWTMFGPRAYLHGEHSPVPAETLALVADTPVFTIPASAHFPMITSPVETLTAILDAIDTLHHKKP